jgi:hypothetical protein
MCVPSCSVRWLGAQASGPFYLLWLPRATFVLVETPSSSSSVCPTSVVSLLFPPHDPSSTSTNDDTATFWVAVLLFVPSLASAQAEFHHRAA